jgi:hypothetical protein
MKDEALKQALKFCEDIGDLRGPYPFVNETSIVSDSRKVLKALRQAIAEAEKQEAVAWIVDGEIKVRLDMAGKLYCSETNVYGKDVVNKAIEQEPVGWLDSEGRFSYFKHLDSDEPLYTAPVHASDEFKEMVEKGTKAWADTPNDWVDELRGGVEEQEFECPRCGHCCPEREWVGLTDEEIEDIYEQEGRADVVLLTQAKLKEKNVP